MLKIKKDPISDDSVAVFHLQGGIDDLADFAPITACVSQDITLDCDKVTGINSFGIRRMANMMTALKGKRVRYEKCRTSLVGQFNMISSLVVGVDVISFYLPYECTGCGTEVEKLINTAKVIEPDFTSRLNSLFTCDRCNRQLTFMDDETIYFHFVEESKAA